MGLERIIRVARGLEPADLVLAGGRHLNVFSGEILEGDVAVADGTIAGIGAYPAKAGRRIDLKGDILLPGFIDAHIHLESTLLSIPEFARAVVPRGTTTVLTDPHEIVNVMGLAGLDYMLASSRGLPLDVYFMASSCVPATRFETAGGRVAAAGIRRALGRPRVLGVAEMMDVPGVLAGDPEVLGKIRAGRGRRIDGHAPLVSGKDLSAYVSAGIRSDHECTRIEEAREKLRLGMTIMMREGTTERNVAALAPLVTPETASRFLLVSDDKHVDDLLDNGHMDENLRRAVSAGIDPVSAVRMATINPALYMGLSDRGAVAPGYAADLAVVSDLETFRVRAVYKGGLLVAANGRPAWRKIRPLLPARHAMRVADFSIDRLRVPARFGRIRVIEIVPGQILTRSVTEDASPAADPERDIAKIAVVERHKASGRIGLGFVRGFGLKAGAIASTVAHDSHNLIVAGTNDRDMAACVRHLVRTGGGLCAAHDGRIAAALPLPIAGLMSDREAEVVAGRLTLVKAAAAILGSRLPDPFMHLSFLALPVVPELRLTDRGLVDVRRNEIVPLFVGP
ncbi:MAG: adenine deaminase [Nitrospirae bacterium RBG_16_64_22]|nr:MAG: adenine deaminase [Nitrospirae bacterium RBG_16_64_22]